MEENNGLTKTEIIVVNKSLTNLEILSKYFGNPKLSKVLRTPLL